MLAFSQLLEAGVAGLVDAITDLQKELRNTQDTVASLQERIRMLEDGNTADLETLVDERIDSALDMRLDDAIESALSGREVEVTLSGSVTL